MENVVRISQIDHDRFGVRTAIATDIGCEQVPELVATCNSEGAELAIVRTRTAEIDAIHALEAEGFRLMDTLVYFSRDLQRAPIPDDIGETEIRPMRPDEADAIRTVAIDAFAGYTGHYHADPRLDASDCDDVYSSWAYASATNREVADEVLVSMMGDDLVAFATLRMNSVEEGEGVLFGVASRAQGHGIYRSLMIGGMHWCAENGATTMVVSTQVTNIAVQKVWSRLGFEPARSYYTLHKWFDS